MCKVVYLSDRGDPATDTASATQTSSRNVQLLANLLAVAAAQTATAGAEVNDKISHIESCLDLIESRIDAIGDPLEQARVRQQGAAVRLALRHSADKLSQAVSQLAQIKDDVVAIDAQGDAALSS